MLTKNLYLIWLSLIILINIIPTNNTSITGSGNPRVMNIYLDHLMHFLGFIFLPVLYFFSLRYGKLRHKTRQYLKVVIVSLFAAALVELVQKLLPYRSYSNKDIVLNIAGVVVGFALFHLFICKSIKEKAMKG